MSGRTGWSTPGPPPANRMQVSARPPSLLGETAPELRRLPAPRGAAPEGFRLLVDPPGEGAWNMAVDEAMAAAVGARRVPATLRLYGWVRPTVSLGYLQRAAAGIDVEACRRLGIPVVRRLTGGRAVLHAAELTYSVAVPLDGPWGALSVAASFRALSAGLVEMLRRLGVAAEIGHPGEEGGPPGDPGLCFLVRRMPAVLVAGRKLLGSAQRRAQDFILQHGSLLLEVDHALHGAVFPGWSQTEARGVTCLAEALGRRPEGAELVAALEAAWSAVIGVACHPGVLTPAERTEALRLVEHRYGSPDWTWRR